MNIFHESHAEMEYRAPAPKSNSTPGSFWWAYALLILAVVLLWRAFA